LGREIVRDRFGCERGDVFVNRVLGNQVRLDLLCAGSAGILLCFAHLQSHLWLASLVALAPLLWRLYRCSARQALSLGLILATTFVTSTYLGCLLASPSEFFLRMVAFNASFAILALFTNRLWSYLRLCPWIIAFLWCPALSWQTPGVGFSDSLVLGSDPDPGFFGAVGLACCAALLGRWLMLILIRLVKRKAAGCRAVRAGGFRRRNIPDRIFRCEFLWQAVPGLRGPPMAYC